MTLERLLLCGEDENERPIPDVPFAPGRRSQSQPLNTVSSPESRGSGSEGSSVGWLATSGRRPARRDPYTPYEHRGGLDSRAKFWSVDRHVDWDQAR